MCTCIDFKTKDFYFGRTLDLEYRYQEQVCITPRNFKFSLKNGEDFHTKYSLIGMATVMKDYPLYYEASNEKGLSMAGLNFPKTNHYFEPKEDKLNLAVFELIPYILGKYSTIDELLPDIKRLNITNEAFMEGFPSTDLHWMISDKDRCIVMEQTNEGLKIYDNPVGVMTNNPEFKYQITNLNNYMNLTPNYVENNFSENSHLVAYGQGLGAIGLPGDFSPVSRFVKACFTKLNSVCENDEDSSVSQFFHILDSVSMVRGSVRTKENKCDITAYSCCINTTLGIYYYKTYDNSQICAIKMTDETKNNDHLSVYDLIEKQNINYINF